MLRGGGLRVPGRSWFRDTLKMRFYLDKNLRVLKGRHVTLWGKRISSREKSQCKDLQGRVCFMCFRSDLEASVRGYPIK